MVSQRVRQDWATEQQQWNSLTWVGDAIQPSHPLSSPSPPAFNLSQHQGLFQWVSFSHQVPKYWSFSFSIIPSNEYSGHISFKMNWFDLVAVQGTLQSLLQHHSSKASILWCSAFFIVQLSHPYMTTGRTIALTRWTFGPIKMKTSTLWKIMWKEWKKEKNYILGANICNLYIWSRTWIQNKRLIKLSDNFLI